MSQTARFPHAEGERESVGGGIFLGALWAYSGRARLRGDRHGRTVRHQCDSILTMQPFEIRPSEALDSQAVVDGHVAATPERGAVGIVDAVAEHVAGVDPEDA